GPGRDDYPNPGSAIADADRTADECREALFAFRRAADRRAMTRARARLAATVAALDKGEPGSERSPAAPLWSDPLTAALTGIRSALAVMIPAAFWFITAWPNGSTAVVMAGIVCTLLAPTKEPAKITAAVGLTILAFAIPLFVTELCLLPYASDFFSMAALLAPYLLTCGFIIAHPKIGPLGLLAAVYLAAISHIDNNSVQSYDALAFFNSSLAYLLGVGVGLVLFATFFPETPQWIARRFFRQLRVHLGRLATASRPAFSAFDFALCEHVAETLAKIQDEPALARDCLRGGAIGISSGRAIERLRAGMAANRQTTGVSAAISNLLAGFSHACFRPSWERLARRASDACAACRTALAEARAADGSTIPVALLDLAAGCETLRSDLLKMQTLTKEIRNVL
ncbi:MAG TPA: FUSC family protein, partial [Bradyrhizobium sp.]|nr:FUSC family protein [Bradyrhizobium sp.]